jgi:vacuolar iron transporter family protein
MYTIDYLFSLDMDTSLLLQISVALTLAAFIAIGFLRGQITKISRKRAVLESFGLGAAAAIISYGVGNLLERVIN